MQLRHSSKGWWLQEHVAARRHTACTRSTALAGESFMSMFDDADDRPKAKKQKKAGSASAGAAAAAQRGSKTPGSSKQADKTGRVELNVLHV